MFYAIVLVVAILGQLTHGVPLEDRSSNYSQFFDSRIVGGTEAPHGKSPHMVALVVGWLWSSFVCGGSIISKKCILTAAHCITGFVQWDGELLSTFHGRVGSNNRHQGTIVHFKGFVNHKKYDSWDIKYDIGILYAEHAIELNKHTAVIPLNIKCRDGVFKCFVTGWGTDMLWGTAPDELQYLAVNTITSQQCKDDVREYAELWGGWAPPIDPKVEICTYHSPGFGMCHGDSGSALVCKGEQYGIVSWGFPCARGAPDVYARVCAFDEFIKAAGCCGHKGNEDNLLE